MKTQLKWVVLSVVASLPWVSLANSVPASSGRPAVWGDGPCFLMTHSKMYNSCTTRRPYELPLPLSSAGNKTVHVSAFGATSANNVGCAAVGLNREGTTYWGGTQKWLPAFGAPQVITLTDSYVPVGGYLYVGCQVDPGATLITVEYNG